MDGIEISAEEVVAGDFVEFIGFELADACLL